VAKKLVIGASGFLGSHVTKHLVQRGQDGYEAEVVGVETAHFFRGSRRAIGVA
jgi:nucleoside-diphosphate-sugar epimerase